MHFRAARLFSLFSLVFATAHAATLTERLNAQFARFDAARAQLIERVGCRDPLNPDPHQRPQPFTRLEWEALLQSPQPLSVAERRALHRRQLATVRRARAEALRESDHLGIRFDVAFRHDAERVEKFCAAFPKGGMLHVHPSGTLDAATAYALLTETNPRLDIDKIQQAVSVPYASFDACELSLLKPEWNGKTFRELDARDQRLLAQMILLPHAQDPFPVFQAIFSMLDTLLPNTADQTIRVFLERARRQGVSYVEFTKGGCPRDAVELETYNQKIQGLEAAGNLPLQMNCAFPRTADAAANGQRARAIFSALRQSPAASRYIRGLDLLGTEAPFPADRVARGEAPDVTALGAGQSIYACYLAEKATGGPVQHCTQHAGEHGDPRDPRDSLILCGDRMGHGVRLAEDLVALEYARRLGTGIEVNLVSNERLGAVPDLGRHPYLNFLRLGLPVSLSTDDEGIFETSMNRECAVAIAHTDVTYAELKRLARNSLIKSFVNEDRRTVLLADLDARLAEFERTHPWELPEAIRDTATPPPAPELREALAHCEKTAAP
jgi:adenosine deaminase CECR1